MIFIGQDIINRLQAGLAFPKVIVRDFYTVSKVTPPMVTLYEQPGEGVLYPDGKARYVRNVYQIEVYCKQQTVGGTPLTANAAAQTLLLQVGEIIENTFGLTQVGDAVTAPYVSDPTIMRGVVRYRGDIDTQTKIIYR